jgi:predicted NBD/HSP70 family sugar kinase
MKILVLDIGGSNVKGKISGSGVKFKISSGSDLTPSRLIKEVQALTGKEKYGAVSIGLPGPVVHGKPAANPPNLGKGWVGFDFEKHFQRPVKIINDAAMQALGSYRGGRMLFVGLGTGVGSALILDDVIVPLELGELAYSKTRTLTDVLSKAHLKKVGLRHWEKTVQTVVYRLAAAFRTDYIVVGGGNAERIRQLPPHTRRGSNDRAFTGGIRLWGTGYLRAKARKHTLVIT